ncbi:MAG: sugar ABC transporter permease [bacterium]|nr:sugar ABC transporter permease [bacterium]
MSRTAPPLQRSFPASIGRRFSDLTGGIFGVFVDLMDRLMAPLQNLLGSQRMAYVFVLPNLIIFGVFIILPMFLNFSYALTGSTQLFPADRPFVGFDNFARIFECSDFLNPNTCREDVYWRAVSNSTGFVIVQVALMVSISLLTALALNRKIILRSFFRSVFFYPVLLSPVVVALIWKWLLQQDGLINALIVSSGGTRVPFLLNADWARLWVILISVWAQMGFFTLILLAGLQSIPAELYEAASMDGANQFDTFRSITLPLLMPTMTVVLVLALIRAVQVFDQVIPFTNGGPGTATTYMVQYIYNTGFSNQTREYGLAAAASVLMAAVLLALTVIQLRVTRSNQSDSA